MLRNLITDVKGIAVGCANDATARTGVTVILPAQPAVCAYASLGGGPGTRETDALAPDTLVEAVHAVVLAGGSVYGLGAADAVTSALGAAGKGFAFAGRTGLARSPVVPAAILYDLANGGDKDWGESPPYARLGREAFANSGADIPLGNNGAGFGALAGDGQGGLGSASAVCADGVVVGALAAVNCVGSVHIPGSDAYWAWPFERHGEFGGIAPPTQPLHDLADWGRTKTAPVAGQNTTIACIAIGAALTPAQARRVAIMATAGFARAIRPVFTPFDGDTVFVLSLGDASASAPGPDRIALYGETAAACLARSIARGVFAARLS